MPKITLTARTLDALKADGKRVDYFDAKLPGFCVRVSAGAKSFAVFYRHGGRLRRLTLGNHPPLSLADARDLAHEALRSVRLGADPAAEKKQERAAESFADLAAQYIELYARKRKKTWHEDDRIIKNKLNPAFGKVRAKDVRRADVRLLLETIAARAPIEANRTLAVCQDVQLGDQQGSAREQSVRADLSARRGTPAGARPHQRRDPHDLEGPRQRGTSNGRNLPASPHHRTTGRRGRSDGSA